MLFFVLLREKFCDTSLKIPRGCEVVNGRYCTCQDICSEFCKEVVNSTLAEDSVSLTFALHSMLNIPNHKKTMPTKIAEKYISPIGRANRNIYIL